MCAKPVDLTGAVADQIGAAGGEDAQVDGYLVAGPQPAQITAHACLVGDDEGVLRVRLGFAAVGARGTVDGQAGEVGHGLVVVEQQADQQGCTAVVDVHGPQHVLVDVQDVADQFQQGPFVVQDPAGEQTLAPIVEHHAVVMLLADVHSGPDPGHGHLRQLVVAIDPADDLADVVLQSDQVAHPNWRSSRRGAPGGHVL